MANIGGNITGILQVKSTSGKNAIGESKNTWINACGLFGWLGLQNGDSKYNNFNAKIEESTHVFLCDFDAGIYSLSVPDQHTGKSKECRAILKGMVYDVLLIDNPDEMDEQLEIYLRKVGAWNG